MWQLELDCHLKPCEANACAGEGVVPARQHQRLPLSLLRIHRMRLYVRLRPVQCSVPNLRSVAYGRPVSRETKNAIFWPLLSLPIFAFKIIHGEP